ncbi:MAG: VCBS repeat-containing protein [Polyangiaceae bacterium]
MTPNARGRFLVLLPTAVLVAAATFAACGNESGGNGNGDGDGGPGDGATSTADGASDGGANDPVDGRGPSFDDDGSASGCSTNAQCDGGVCNQGTCCRDVASACGTTCCGSGSVCLFDRCVVPGSTCRSSRDCASDEVCETALGTPLPDAGPRDAACTAPAPLSGRCIPKPPVCADGGTGPDCVTKCEYRPPEGTLDPVVKWRWGFDTANLPFPDHVDVWSTPVVGRLRDGNCDGRIDELDPPNVVFVSGDARTAAGVGTCCQCTGKTPEACHTGVLRVLDGRTGAVVLSLARVPSSAAGFGFAGLSPALGDVDGDGKLEIIAATGDGLVVVLDADGNVKKTSTDPVATRLDDAGTRVNAVADTGTFGWGGGLAVADMDADGFPEIVYGRSVFTTKGAGTTLTRVFEGRGGIGASLTTALSFFADLDGVPGSGVTDAGTGDGGNRDAGDAGPSHLELVAGNTAYRSNGSFLWRRNDLGDGFAAVADFDGLYDTEGMKHPEVALVVGTANDAGVTTSKLYLLDGRTGATIGLPFDIPGTGEGGPPTIADFDGDGRPDVGVALATKYAVMRWNRDTSRWVLVWSHDNHDLSSSVTGSTVFDFEGDGKAEVVYADECYLWVWGFDRVAQKAVVRLATSTTSFTATEAPVVADVDGDGHSDIVMVSNRADPGGGSPGWNCNVPPWNDPAADAGRPPGVPMWRSPAGLPAGSAYRGITVFSDSANSWVGTRTLWNQHAYHVTNVCDDRDNACNAPNTYGLVPRVQRPNSALSWLNNFRQNVQETGLFDAPDAVVSLKLECSTPVKGSVAVKNAGLTQLPAGVVVVVTTANGTEVARVTTTHPLLASQTELVPFTTSQVAPTEALVGAILVDPAAPKFRQCRSDNDVTPPTKAVCSGPR